MDLMTIGIMGTNPARQYGRSIFPAGGAGLPTLYSQDIGLDSRRVAYLNLEQAYMGYMAGIPQDSTVPSSRGFYIINGQGAGAQSFQDFDAFMKEMQRQLEEARRRAGQGGANPPAQPGNQKVNLDLAAHGYYEGDKWHPVKEIRAWEANNYKNRTYKTFIGDWYEPEYNLKWQNVPPQKYYKVRVTWDNGESRTYDIRPEAGGWKTKRYDFWR